MPYLIFGILIEDESQLEELQMDIAALSIGMSQSQLQQSVSLAVTKKAMDNSETQSNGLLQLMNTASAPHPTLGKSIDIQA
jgi:hypothetical protein